MTDRAAWLAGLGVGDEVCVERGGAFREMRVGKVARITPKRTLIVVTGHLELRFNRDGAEPGFDRGRFSIEPLTDEARAQIEHAGLVTRLKALPWSTLPLETLRRVGELVEEKYNG